MKQLTNDMMDLIYRSIQAANTMGISSISIEQNEVGKMIRGFSADFGAPVVICHTLTDELPFRAFAIHDCRSFGTKLVLAQKKDGNFKPMANINENTNFVTDVEFKGGGFKLKFNAGRPDTVKAPKGVKDTNIGQFILSKEDIITLNDAVSAMGAEYVTFIYDGSNLQLEVKGSTEKDVFVCDLINPLKSTTDETIKPFAHSFLFKTISPALKASTTGEMYITSKGLLNCFIRDINVFIFPRKA